MEPHLAKKRDLDKHSLWQDCPKHKKASREDNVALIVEAQAGNEEARAHLVRNNTRLVFRYARRYVTPWAPFEDLVQEGAEGLNHAVDKFDPEFGTRFSTFAGLWIHQRIRRYSKQARLIHIPECKLLKVHQLRNLLKEADLLGEELSDSYILKALKLKNESKLEDLRHCVSQIIPLSAAKTEPGERAQPLDISSDYSLEGAYEQETLREALRGNILRLDPQTRSVIEARFGITNGPGETKPLTLKKIAEKEGVSETVVSRIIRQGLSQLREELASMV